MDAREKALEQLNEARERIKREVSCLDYLDKAKKSGYICPVCQSGSHTEGTGAVKYYSDTNTWACHACTDGVKADGKAKKLGGDVIKLYMLTKNVDHNEALRALARECNVDVETPLRELAKAGNTKMGKAETGGGVIKVPTANIKIRQDYTAYYAECKARLPEARAYIESRGISYETAERYGLGFDPKADPAGTGHPCPRLIIPVTKSHYVARRTDGGQDFKKMNPKGSTPGIFNADVIKGETGAVFITEGAIDALSVIECGENAVGLNSAGNAAELVKLVEKERPKATFILCLDNDNAGSSATETLRAGLTRLNIPFVCGDICGESKDPNEALTTSKDLFLSAIETAKQLAVKPDNTALYIASFMGRDLEKFKDDIPTGYENLDLCCSGLYPGLYVVAAVSSLGKTTFTLQMAEQVAKSGRDVVFFSLEQSRFEMVSKGIARRTAQADMKKAVNSLSIRKGYLPKQVQEAAKTYTAEVGDRLSIVEGNFRCDVGFIAEYLREYMRKNKVRPVCFVDYLQILTPTDERQSTKDAMDTAVTALKRMSREMNIPVVVISSVNRANYLTPIEFESLKESGGIEYTADCIWGLQFQCLNDDMFAKDKNTVERRKRIKEAKEANPRKIELACLKNRYGVSRFSCYFDYYPAYDLFVEGDERKLDFTPHSPRTKKAGTRG